MFNTASMSACSPSYPFAASSPRSPANWRLVIKNPGQLGARVVRWAVRMRGAPGAAWLMSHHMGNFVHARDDEYLPLAACFAFERAASTSRASMGSISLIEVSPPHAGHSPRAPMGADWGACMLCPFRLELSASPWKVHVRLGLSVGRLTNPVCAILTTSLI